jgi:hypothetical protein
VLVRGHGLIFLLLIMITFIAALFAREARHESLQRRGRRTLRLLTWCWCDFESGLKAEIPDHTFTLKTSLHQGLGPDIKISVRER